MDDPERAATLERIVTNLRRYSADMADAGRRIADSPLASTGLAPMFEKWAAMISAAMAKLTLEATSVDAAVATLEQIKREIDEEGVGMGPALDDNVTILRELSARLRSG